LLVFNAIYKELTGHWVIFDLNFNSPVKTHAPTSLNHILRNEHALTRKEQLNLAKSMPRPEEARSYSQLGQDLCGNTAGSTTWHQTIAEYKNMSSNTSTALR
jgi:hypothetical protein